MQSSPNQTEQQDIVIDAGTAWTVRDDTDPRLIIAAELLGEPLYAAIGIAESLRLWARYYVPKLDIGKYSNRIIAIAIGFNEDRADQLVEALVASGWINKSEEHRLVLAGWSWKKLGTKTARRRHYERLAGGQLSAKARRLVFERDGYMCQYCASSADLTVDHIVPISLNGTNIDSNLQTLCRPCNSRKKDSIVSVGVN